MIQPISDRRSFDELHSHGHVLRSGPLFVRMLDDGSTPPRLGFAIGRKYGNAVARNRAQRRLRALFREEAKRQPNLTGTFLVGAGGDFARAPHSIAQSWVETIGRNARVFTGQSGDH